MGNIQTTKIIKQIKSLNVSDAFLSAGYTESSKFERVMIVQTHAYRGMGDFSYLSPKSSKLLLLGGKIRKIFHFPHGPWTFFAVFFFVLFMGESVKVC